MIIFIRGRAATGIKPISAFPLMTLAAQSAG